ncbi:VWA domain-containing protein [Haloarculaceae archaeon H-GB11]|nr:VWA domain-containing protein [Haloarculaceae archaeon H-GB11]
MALQDVFLTPTGLLALLALVPLVVLYLLRPDPRELALPTAEFLVDDPEEQGSNPVFDRLVRNLLFLLQALVLLALAVSLASPYVTVEEGFSPKETVLVVDASASMATSSGGQSRLAAAKQAARDDAAGTTSVVVTGATTGTVLEAEDGPLPGRRSGPSRAPTHRATSGAPSRKRRRWPARTAASSSSATSWTRAAGGRRSSPHGRAASGSNSGSSTAAVRTTSASSTAR